ncbi:MAG: hypothetical protein HYU97_02965 [Deltaproteobacteria bacterium]|nr:hypothetical protein [Deltaproteobacteria bacterium]
MNDEYKKNLLEIRDGFLQKARKAIKEIDCLNEQFPHDHKKIESLQTQLRELQTEISQVMEFIKLKKSN